MKLSSLIGLLTAAPGKAKSTEAAPTTGSGFSKILSSVLGKPTMIGSPKTEAAEPQVDKTAVLPHQSAVVVKAKAQKTPGKTAAPTIDTGTMLTAKAQGKDKGSREIAAEGKLSKPETAAAPPQTRKAETQPERLATSTADLADDETTEIVPPESKRPTHEKKTIPFAGKASEQIGNLIAARIVDGSSPITQTAYPENRRKLPTSEAVSARTSEKVGDLTVKAETRKSPANAAPVNIAGTGTGSTAAKSSQPAQTVKSAGPSVIRITPQITPAAEQGLAGRRTAPPPEISAKDPTQSGRSPIPRNEKSSAQPLAASRGEATAAQPPQGEAAAKKGEATSEHKPRVAVSSGGRQTASTGQPEKTSVASVDSQTQIVSQSKTDPSLSKPQHDVNARTNGTEQTNPSLSKLPSGVNARANRTEQTDPSISKLPSGVNARTNGNEQVVPDPSSSANPIPRTKESSVSPPASTPRTESTTAVRTPVIENRQADSSAKLPAPASSRIQPPSRNSVIASGDQTARKEPAATATEPARSTSDSPKVGPQQATSSTADRLSAVVSILNKYLIPAGAKIATIFSDRGTVSIVEKKTEVSPAKSAATPVRVEKGAGIDSTSGVQTAADAPAAIRHSNTRTSTQERRHSNAPEKPVDNSILPSSERPPSTLRKLWGMVFGSREDRAVAADSKTPGQPAAPSPAGTAERSQVAESSEKPSLSSAVESPAVTTSKSQPALRTHASDELFKVPSRAESRPLEAARVKTPKQAAGDVRIPDSETARISQSRISDAPVDKSTASASTTKPSATASVPAASDAAQQAPVQQATVQSAKDTEAADTLRSLWGFRIRSGSGNAAKEGSAITERVSETSAGSVKPVRVSGPVFDTTVQKLSQTAEGRAAEPRVSPPSNPVKFSEPATGISAEAPHAEAIVPAVSAAQAEAEIKTDAPLAAGPRTVVSKHDLFSRAVDSSTRPEIPSDLPREAPKQAPASREKSAPRETRGSKDLSTEAPLKSSVNGKETSEPANNARTPSEIASRSEAPRFAEAWRPEIPMPAAKERSGTHRSNPGSSATAQPVSAAQAAESTAKEEASREETTSQQHNSSAQTFTPDVKSASQPARAEFQSCLPRLSAEQIRELQELVQKALESSRAAVRGNSEMTFDWRQKDLGTLRFSISTNDRDVSVTIQSDRPEVADSIEKSRAVVERMITDAGLRIERFDVQLRTHADGQQNRSNDFADRQLPADDQHREAREQRSTASAQSAPLESTPLRNRISGDREWVA